MRRKFFVFTFLAACMAGIATIFWSQEIKYNLPTPIPLGYKTVALQSQVSFSDKLASPAFLHFYNPDCPCSRFNATHLQQLISSHSSSIQFLIVVPSEKDIEKARNSFGESINYVVDSHGKMASACGVYSTPQAVIIDEESRLFFRGNYNKSRYCTSQASNYAELALLSYLNGQPLPLPVSSASLAYGCELSNETNILPEIF